MEKQLLERFDNLCKKEGVYIRSEGMRKAVISALRKGSLNG